MLPFQRLAGAVLMAGGLIAAGAGELRAEPAIGKVFQRPFLGATGARVDGSEEYLYFNTTIYQDETVSTVRGGSTALRFADGTKLQVGASSVLVLDRFVYDPGTGVGDALISFTKGIFRFISGDIPEESLVLETPSATLAIRGTKFVLFIDAQGTTDVWVIEGAVEAQPREGAPVTAQAGQSMIIIPGTPGIRLVDGRTAPRDPAIEDDLSFFGPPGLRDRDDGGSRRGGSGGQN